MSADLQKVIGKDSFDVVIIGAGPVGLFTAFQAGMVKLRACVIDALEHVGGQCSTLYPDKPIYDIPAYSSITGEGLVRALMQQLEPFDTTFLLGKGVVSIAGDATAGFEVELSSGKRIRTWAVVVAGGAGAFAPTRPPLVGIEQYEGKSVFFHVSDSSKFVEKTLVIAGGGDSAVDWANYFAGRAAHIYLVHRRDRFRAAPASIDRLYENVADGLVELVVPYQLDALSGKDDGRLKSVTVASLDGKRRDLEADFLLPMFGLVTNLGPISDWGLDLSDGCIQVDPSNCMTRREGVYAVGDIASYPGKLKLILTGFADGANSMHAEYCRRNSGKVVTWEHSTSKGVPV